MGNLLLIILIGYLGFEIYRRKNQPANSSYTKNKNGDWTDFSVIPGRETIRAALIVPGAGCLIAALLAPGGFKTFFIVMTAICVWFTFLPVRPKSQRSASHFRVSPTTIDTGGQQFPVEDIHRIVIKNAVDTDFVLVATNNRAAVSQAQHAEDKIRAAKMAFYLNLEEGGRDHMLAGGMSETTANGLMTDVARIIGFSESA